MPTQTPHAPTGKATLTERYVHAATRSLPEDQRDDVADELRGSIADRVESLQEQHPGLSGADAEYAALEELGDPDRLAAGYTGRRLQLIGPELYPTYTRLLKAVLVAAVPVSTLVIAIIDAATGSSVGEVVGGAAWMALTISVHIVFWITLTFALVERGSATSATREGLGADWTPKQLPEVPRGTCGSLGELIAAVAWPAFLGAALVWQQLRSPLHVGGDSLPVLDPDLWSFWLPLVLVLLVVEMVFEVVKYRLGRWTAGVATANLVLGAAFAAPLVYLAASDQLLNPAAVAEIQDGWTGFDPVVVNTIVIVAALVIWAWDSFDGWRRTLAQG